MFFLSTFFFFYIQNTKKKLKVLKNKCSIRVFVASFLLSNPISGDWAPHSLGGDELYALSETRVGMHLCHFAEGNQWIVLIIVESIRAEAEEERLSHSSMIVLDNCSRHLQNNSTLKTFGRRDPLLCFGFKSRQKKFELLSIFFSEIESEKS